MGLEVNDKQRWNLFRKYRAIIIAITLFLVCDLTVLGVNFYSSFEMTQYAISINLAGRERMLSQRMTKALLLLQTSDTPVERRQHAEELKLVVELFDSSLKGFRSGLMVKGGDLRPVWLNRVETVSGQDIVNSAYQIWVPYLAVLSPLIQASNPEAITPEQVVAAANYARASNLTLLSLMNDLTTDLEHTANGKAEVLRWIQTIGILAALINFSYTVFMSIRDLVSGDRKLEQARRENDEILATVKEGLFLLDKEFCFGTQYSKSLPAILHQKIHQGQAFLPILREMVPERTYVAAKDYIELLFGDRVKEALVVSLNPLNQVEAWTEDTLGQRRARYLTFHFNRVIEDGRISHLLVTVQDVTEQVRLAAQLEQAKHQAKIEVETLLKLMNNDPETLQQFFTNTESVLDVINESLKSGDESEQSRSAVLNAMLRSVHSIKGEAAVLGIEMLETYAHDFEREIITVRDRGELSGNEMVRITVLLDGFYDQLNTITRVVNHMATSEQGATQAGGEPFSENLRLLARRIASEQQKQVEVRTKMDQLAKLPQDLRAKLEHIIIQLLRNAVTHGIEPTEERGRVTKPTRGTVEVRCARDDNGQLELVVRDDGRGIDLQDIRDALVRRGLADATTAAAMNEHELMQKLFDPGFSTRQSADRDAGHGIGLDIVAAKVAELAGHLNVVSRADEFTEFRIQLAIPS